jgi:hypothetical protein
LNTPDLLMVANPPKKNNQSDLDRVAKTLLPTPPLGQPYRFLRVLQEHFVGFRTETPLHYVMARAPIQRIEPRRRPPRRPRTCRRVALRRDRLARNRQRRGHPPFCRQVRVSLPTAGRRGRKRNIPRYGQSRETSGFPRPGSQRTRAGLARSPATGRDSRLDIAPPVERTAQRSRPTDPFRRQSGPKDRSRRVRLRPTMRQ